MTATATGCAVSLSLSRFSESLLWEKRKTTNPEPTIPLTIFTALVSTHCREGKEPFVSRSHTRDSVNLWPQRMASSGDPPPGTTAKGQRCYTVWNTLFEIEAKYVPIKPVGRGSYGVVCSSINSETNERVAIKKISNTFDHPIHALRTLRELRLLRNIQHRNVIALKDVMMPSHRSSFKDVYLVYELMDTDLAKIINFSTPISTDHCKFLLFQLLEGLKYLHSSNVLHRDLKPGNLLVNANGDLKICDFGLARTKQENNQSMTEYVCTRWYRAPELLLGCDSYETSIDMWSVGCVFAEILGRSPIFPGTDCLNQVNLILDLLGSPQEEDLDFIRSSKVKEYIKSRPFSTAVEFSRCYPSADPLGVDLLQKMLVFNPAKRISAIEALEHPYMAGLHDPKHFPPPRLAIHLDVDEKVGEDTMREMILKEILYYHPQVSSSL